MGNFLKLAGVLVIGALIGAGILYVVFMLMLTDALNH